MLRLHNSLHRKYSIFHAELSVFEVTPRSLIYRQSNAEYQVDSCLF